MCAPIPTFSPESNVVGCIQLPSGRALRHGGDRRTLAWGSDATVGPTVGRSVCDAGCVQFGPEPRCSPHAGLSPIPLPPAAVRRVVLTGRHLAGKEEGARRARIHRRSNSPTVKNLEYGLERRFSLAYLTPSDMVKHPQPCGIFFRRCLSGDLRVRSKRMCCLACRSQRNQKVGGIVLEIVGLTGAIAFRTPASQRPMPYHRISNKPHSENGWRPIRRAPSIKMAPRRRGKVRGRVAAAP